MITLKSLVETLLDKTKEFYRETNGQGEARPLLFILTKREQEKTDGEKPHVGLIPLSFDSIEEKRTKMAIAGIAVREGKVTGQKEEIAEAVLLSEGWALRADVLSKEEQEAALEGKIRPVNHTQRREVLQIVRRSSTGETELHVWDMERTKEDVILTKNKETEKAGVKVTDNLLSLVFDPKEAAQDIAEYISAADQREKDIDRLLKTPGVVN